MKQFRQVMGVTLLEIMLVLAIAAMIIVMSIRYYQSATASSQANATMSQIQSIAATADNLAIATGSYSTTVSTSKLSAVLGSANMRTSTNGSITVTASGSTMYDVTMPLTPNVCANVQSKLTTNEKFTGTGGSGSPSCDTSGTLTYTYDNAK